MNLVCFSPSIEYEVFGIFVGGERFLNVFIFFLEVFRAAYSQGSEVESYDHTRFDLCSVIGVKMYVVVLIRGLSENAAFYCVHIFVKQGVEERKCLVFFYFQSEID